MTGLEDFDTVDAAGENDPLPPGEYVAEITKGEYSENRNGNPRYTLTYQVADGEFKGRKFWQDLFLTPAALPYAKRDLLKLSITTAAQLSQPLPCKFRCRVRLALREADNGASFNRVVRFDVLSRVEHEADTFAPAAGAGGVQG